MAPPTSGGAIWMTGVEMDPAQPADRDLAARVHAVLAHRDVGRPHHHRVADKLQFQPVSRVPAPTTLTNVVATLHGPTRSPRTGCTWSAATTTPAAPTSWTGRGRARRQRRRIGHLGRARARAGDGVAADRGDDRVRAVRRGGAGPVRLRPLRRGRQGRPAGTSRAYLNMDIIGSPLGGNGVQRPVQDPAVLGGRADERDPRGDRAPADDRRRERRGLAPARPLRQGDGRERRDRMRVKLDLATRPVPAQRRPGLVPAARLARRAVHRAERELRPPAPGRPRRERQAVRRPAPVRRLPLPRARDPRSGSSLAALARSPRPPATPRAHGPAVATTPSCAGREPRARRRGLRGRLA